VKAVPADGATAASGTPAALAQAAGARERRRLRALTAERVLAHAPEAAAELDWDVLDAAPDWLAWPEAEALRFQCQVGALQCAPAIRLWIDAPRLAAARSLLGGPVLQALLDLPDSPLLPHDRVLCPRIDSAGQVAPMLRAAGAAVLLSALPPGPLRRAVEAAMAPTRASNMAPVLAQSLIERTRALVARHDRSAQTAKDCA